jgi:hypothetical protein
MLTSSSSSSRHLYPSFYLFFNNVFLEGIPYTRRDHPISLPCFHYLWDISLLLVYMQYFFTPHTIGPTDLLLHFPTQHFQTFQVLLKAAEHGQYYNI